MKPCERAWCIDRVQGHRLQGHTRRTMNASSRQHCLELCLGERDFLCRWVWEQRLFFRLPRRESYSTRGRERGGGEGARFPPTWFLFPLGRGRARYPPEEKRSWGRGGWTHSRFDANRHNLSLSLLLLSFSSSPRIEGCTLRCVFQLLGSSNLREGGKRTVTSRSYRVSSVSWSWGGRCFVRGERGERERNSRRPGQRFRSTVGLFTGLFSRSLCYFI